MVNEEFEVDDVEETEDTFEEEDNATELTVEDYEKEKARRVKAEKALVELKKQAKTKPKEETWEFITKEELEIEKFISKNPDLEDYKEELAKYKKLWLSLDKAKLLIENDDKTIENRKKTNSMNVTDWEVSWKTEYSYAELEKMSQSEYNKVKELQLNWKVKFKN